MYAWMLFVLCWQIVADYGNKSVGVFVMSTEDYLTNFYPTIQTVLELYYSLAAVNAEVNESGKLLPKRKSAWSAVLALVVWKMDNAIHQINRYLVDSPVCFVNNFPLDSNLSSG